MVSRYMLVQTTDLRTRAKSFKVYERPTVGAATRVPSGRVPTAVCATREEAETRLHELEQEEK